MGACSWSATVMACWAKSTGSQEQLGRNLGRGGLHSPGARQKHVRHFDASLVPECAPAVGPAIDCCTGARCGAGRYGTELVSVFASLPDRCVLVYPKVFFVFCIFWIYYI